MAETKPDIQETKNDAHYATLCADFLRHYVPPQPDKPKDLLEGRYRIELSVPLAEFNTKTAAAYAVTDIHDGSRQLYALICRPGTVQRFSILERLKRFNHPNVLSLVTYGTANLSQPDAERFVLIYERPRGQRLSEIIENAGVLGEHFLARSLLSPLAYAISELGNIGITHGKINPANIYYQDTPILGEFASEPCGYSQDFYFEPLERMQSHPAGKGNGTPTTDFYALAVLLLYSIYGKQHFSTMSKEYIIGRMFEEGTYYALTRNRQHPERFDDLLRGILSNNPTDRWGWKYIKAWLDGRRMHVLEPPAPTETTRPFEFGNRTARSRRELAHIMFEGWTNIPEAIHNNKIVQWTTVSLRNKTVSENLTRIIKTINELGVKNELQFNEQLMRLILTLDPTGPIRMYPLSMFLDGIDTLCTEFYTTKQEKEFNLLARFVDMNMTSSWMNAQSAQENYEPSPDILSANQKLDKLRVCMRNTGVGFGIERIVYELNPDMPCLSPLLEGRYIDNLTALLMRLDSMAANLSRNTDPLDRHIFAYLAAKLNIQHDIKLLELESIPTLARNRDIIMLRLLATAQHRCGNIQLPGLTHWLASRILPALDAIRGNTNRHMIKKALLNAADTGYTQNMASIVIDSAYSTADTRGFAHAYNLYHNNVKQIAAFRKGVGFEFNSGKLAFTIAKGFAYAALFITFYTINRQI